MKILEAARECIGTPHVHQGRLVGVGLDCIGLFVHVAKSIGAEHADQLTYGTTPTGGALEKALNEQAGIERVADMQPGDVLLMRFATDPQHVAIFTGENIIHSYSTIQKVCEHRLDDAWRKRIVAIYRFKGA